MDILLCGSFDDDERNKWLETLAAAFPDGRWHVTKEAVDPRQIRAAVVANPLPGSLLGLPNLELIQSLWAGVDRLMQDESLPAQVPIARMVDPAMNQAMAETALWATLSLHRRFYRYAAQQHSGQWRQMPQRRADEVRVTVMGMGQMGQRCAGALAAQGYPVTGWRTKRGITEAGIDIHTGADALTRLLAESEVVINLLPLTPDTRGILDARLFAAMRPGAGLVNLARGAHLIEADLLAALASGQVGHAVLDVFNEEPLPVDHAFWGHPQVTLLPHVAAMTDNRSASAMVAKNLRALRDARPLANLVDRERGY